MTHDEAIKTIREALEKLSALKGSWDGERYSLEESDVWHLSRPALTALDSLSVEPSELDSAMAWLEDESIRPSYDTMRKLCIQLARKQRAVEPSEDAMSLSIQAAEIFRTDQNGIATHRDCIDLFVALITARDSATEKRVREECGGSLAEMGSKLRATMERLHADAELRNAVAYAAPFYGAIDKMLGDTK